MRRRTALQVPCRIGITPLTHLRALALAAMEAAVTETAAQLIAAEEGLTALELRP
jgi:hypothetical protein